MQAYKRTVPYCGGPLQSTYGTKVCMYHLILSYHNKTTLFYMMDIFFNGYMCVDIIRLDYIYFTFHYDFLPRITQPVGRCCLHLCVRNNTQNIWKPY